MNWLKAGFGRLLLIASVLTACTGMGQPVDTGPVYDVRSAVVLGGPGVGAGLLSGINDRVNAAINATIRSAVYPRVVLTIRVVSVQKGQGFDKNRATAKIAVDAASVEDGSVIAVSSFDVVSTAIDGTFADQILAEEVAARLRIMFQLNTGRA